MHLFRSCFLVLITACLLAFAAALPACADRDIVYSARYYDPPGSHRTSHFHLYRINPDGTGRTQLTYGSNDDRDPLWSPDGRWILFERDIDSDQHWACVIASSGGPVRYLRVFGDASWSVRWSPDGRMISCEVSKAHSSEALLLNWRTQAVRRLRKVEDILWSPDARKALLDVAGKNGDQGEILTWKTGRRVPLANLDETVGYIGQVAVWQDHAHLVGIASHSTENHTFLSIYDSKGHEIGHRVLDWQSSPSAQGFDSDLGSVAGLLPGPVGHLWIIWIKDASITSWRDYLFKKCDVHSAKVTPFTEGQFLIFSPNGHRFCVSPHQYLMRYALRRDGSERHVWGTPLQIGRVRGGLIYTITPGLVYVGAADWRTRHL